MSAYSKKYSHPTRTNDFVFVTWETGYRNLNVYRNGEVVATANGVQELFNGVSVNTPEIGTLRLGLTKDKPIRLLVEIDGERYSAAKETTEDAEVLNRISYIFWALFILGGIGFVILLSQVMPLISIPTVLVAVILDGLIVLSYGATALLVKRLSWLYYVGTGIYLLTSILTALAYVAGTQSGNIIAFLIRIAILVYLFVLLPKVLRIKRPGKGDQVEDILDLQD